MLEPLENGELKPRVAFEKSLRAVTGLKHTEYMLDGQPVTPNDRLTAEDCRIARNSLKQFLFLHAAPFVPIVAAATQARWTALALRLVTRHLSLVTPPSDGR